MSDDLKLEQLLEPEQRRSADALRKWITDQAGDKDKEFARNLSWLEGVKAESNSAIVNLLRKDLDDERNMAYAALAVIDPGKLEEIRKLQNVIWRADFFEDTVVAKLEMRKETQANAVEDAEHQQRLMDEAAQETMQ